MPRNTVVSGRDTGGGSDGTSSRAACIRVRLLTRSPAQGESLHNPDPPRVALTAAGSGISSYVLLNHINKKNCSLKRSAEFTGTNPSHHSCRHRAACALSTAPPSKPLRRGLLLQFFFLIQSPQRLSAMAHADPFRPWWRGAGSVPLAVPAPGHAPGHTAQPRRCSGVKRAGGLGKKHEEAGGSFT